jgi:hypothetical protein
MSCLETYATLRVFSATLAPESIGAALGIAATQAIPADPDSRYRNRREWNLWKWSTQGVMHSRDNLEHLQAVVSLLEGKADQLASLRALGCQTDIFCYWVSSGQGGPYLDSATMLSLTSLGLGVAWDVYFGEESDYLEEGAGENVGGA